jgi:uncharacterized pyridoxamine 5'-phosphate oxidase family protein
MEMTFVFCKHMSLKMVDRITKALGPSRAIAYHHFDGNFENCESAAILFSFEHGQIEPGMLNFINVYSQQLKMKKVALITVTENEPDDIFAIQNAAKKLGENVVWSGCIQAGDRENSPILSDESADRLVTIKRKLKDSADMPRELLKQEIEKFLQLHNTCALCTGQGDCLRVTPIEYVYVQNAVYFLSEGGEKFIHLQANPQVSIAVYDSYTGFNTLGGLQIEGTAQMVELFGEEYKEVVTRKGLNAENLKKLPVVLHMFKVQPKRFELLESALTKNHYRAKQVLEISDREV